uniref:Holin n=1 Tax=Streptomyces sp. NBC_00003 TaxID=2903608 RepID=A0AAU2V6L9_9ACTN
MAKIALTLLWATVCIAANKALDDVTWAHFLATFILAGVYAYVIDKVPDGRGKGSKEGSER